MLIPSRRFAAPLVTMLLLAGMVACSSDDAPADSSSTVRPTEAAGPATSAEVAGEVDDDGGQVFADTDGFATALKAAVGADGVGVDGDTIRLTFDDGSVDDVMAHINCSAATSLRERGEQIVLSFPDGEVDCEVLLGLDDVPSDAAGTAGTATVTIGDESWQVGNMTCGFGTEGTGIEGSEINLVAGDGNISLYLAVDPGLRYVEVTDIAGGREFTTLGADEPDIVVAGTSVSATGQFVSPDHTGAFSDPIAGTVTAVCP